MTTIDASIAPLGFDYASLHPATQTALHIHARRLGSLSQDAAVTLWEMGSILSDAQRRLASYGNGMFKRWVEEESGLGSVSTAYRLLNVHRRFVRSTLERTSIATSALYALAEPSTPPEAREEAVYRAEQGESISHSTAREIVSQYQPLPPPLPPLPEPPPVPPLPEPPGYQEFEREELMPHLHDAGNPDAPQMLSGVAEAPKEVPEDQKERATQSLRRALLEVLRECVGGLDLDDGADKILEILSQGNSSISIAARFGVALAAGPKTLADLTEIAVWTCGASMDGMERDVYLAWRKRVLRVLDAMSYSNGCCIFEHRLKNGQIAYGLLAQEGCEDDG